MRQIVLVILFAFSAFALGLDDAQAQEHDHGDHLDAAFPVVGGYPYKLDIARNPNDVPSSPLSDRATVTITAHEIAAYLAPKHNASKWKGPDSSGHGEDVKFRYFAFGGGHSAQDQTPRVPGPFIRLRAGNTVTVRLDNTEKGHDPEQRETHSIDFHAVIGKKGGGAVLMAKPGKAVEFTFAVNSPGLYVYHCVGDGTPHGIAHHMNNGMFGLILVEPANTQSAGSFSRMIKDAKEFYVFQQDIFLSGQMHHSSSSKGKHAAVLDYDEERMLNTLVPDYSVFNGRIGALIDHPMEAEVGRNAVIYFGSSGSHVPSPHIIGEIFDWVYDQGDIVSEPLQNVQTALVPSAGSSVFVMDGRQLVPTNTKVGDLNILVDHALPYFRKGALGLMTVAKPN